MRKFDELRRVALAAIEREDCDRFIQRDDAQSVLELLELVDALREIANGSYAQADVEAREAFYKVGIAP